MHMGFRFFPPLHHRDRQSANKVKRPKKQTRSGLRVAEPNVPSLLSGAIKKTRLRARACRGGVSYTEGYWVRNGLWTTRLARSFQFLLTKLQTTDAQTKKGREVRSSSQPAIIIRFHKPSPQPLLLVSYIIGFSPCCCSTPLKKLIS